MATGFHTPHVELKTPATNQAHRNLQRCLKRLNVHGKSFHCTHVPEAVVPPNWWILDHSILERDFKIGCKMQLLSATSMNSASERAPRGTVQQLLPEDPIPKHRHFISLTNALYENEYCMCLQIWEHAKSSSDKQSQY